MRKAGVDQVGVEEGENSPVKDWSLITGRGGLKNGRRGDVKFYLYEKGRWKKI